MKLLLSFLFIWVLALNLSESKVIQEKMGPSLLRSDTWYVMTKFVTAKGQGSYDMKIWNQSPKKGANQTVEMTLHLFTLENWKQQLDLPTCEEKEKFSSHKQVFKLPLSGTFVTLPKGVLEADQPKVWYFVLSSCGNSYNHILLQSNKIQYELTIKNSDGSHISEDQNGVMLVLIITMIPIFFFFLFHSAKMVEFYSSKAALDYPLVMLLFSLVLEFFALSSELLYLYTYSLNGKGFILFNWASSIFSNLSQFLISLLFLLMATGWTVKTLNRKEEDLFVIVGIIVGFLIIGVAIFGKLSVNEIDRFHDYESWPGLLSLLIKLVLYFFFGNQVLNNYEKSDQKLKVHFAKLGIFGSIYLLSFPITVIITDFFLPEYLRHKATTYVTIISQTTTLLAYASLLSFKEGEYYPIVFKNRSLLPLNKLR